MSNPYFRFKQFTVYHHRSAMKVTTDACLFGAWCAAEIQKAIVKINKALDIGTGTGLLSLMVAQKTDFFIEAVEMDKAAAEQARENVAASPWKDNITVFHEDILQYPFQTYDCIISNPPFYEAEIESQQLKRNIAHHSKGLKFGELIPVIAERLTESGLFFLLLPAKRLNETEKLISRYPLAISKKVVVRQSPLHPPFRVLMMGTKVFYPVHTETSELCIRDEQQQYTPEFIHLLKDYYLYL